MNAPTETPNAGSGCLPGFLKFLGQPQSSALEEVAPATFPYERKDLLSAAERSFFGVLKQAVGKDFHIFSKIRLVDLIDVQKNAESRRGHLNRITAKHIDFILCDQAKVAPVLVIELDDSSHKRKDRQERDQFVDGALEAAGLPLLRIPAQAGYDVVNIRDVVMNMVRP